MRPVRATARPGSRPLPPSPGVRQAGGMQQMSLREYIDNLERDGYTVRDDHGDDPMLIRPDGRAVETWREDYPYDELMSRNDYEVEKYLLQIELLKFQYWVQDSRTRHVIVFEGRDAAGKGGTIKRFMEHLKPRGRRAGDGLLRRRRVPHLHAAGAGVRGDAARVGHPRDQAVVLGDPAGAAHAVRRTPARSRTAVEAVADGPREPRQVGGLHRGQGGDVPAHGHRPRTVVHGEEQRQEARSDQRTAAVPQPRGL